MAFKKNKIIKFKGKKINSLFSLFNTKIKFYFLFIFMLTFLTFIIDIINTERKYINKLFFYFTNQTIFSILLVLFSFFFKIKNKKIYSIFIFATIVNALLTCIVFNLFLKPFWNSEKSIILVLIRGKTKIKNFISLSQHILIPLSYFLFFFLFIPFIIDNLKEIFCTFFHPLLYLSIYFLKFLFFEDYEKHLLIEKQECSNYFPYPNIQCFVHGEVFFKQPKEGDIYIQAICVFMRILILTFLFIIFFIFIFILKKKRFNKKNIFLNSKVGIK